MKKEYSCTFSVKGLLIGIIEAEEVTIGHSSQELINKIDEAVKEIKLHKGSINEERRKKIRNMLRFGEYKPTGRSKPASEYLVRTALSEEGFPKINNAVDINNFLSLKSALPMSLFDSDLCTNKIKIEHAPKNSKYIFNLSGQEMVLTDLLCVCEENEGGLIPIGNPVKDSLRTKITENTKNLFAVIYATEDAISKEEFEFYTKEFAKLLETYCHAKKTETLILHS